MTGDPSDVNARVTADWVEETTPFERVRTVVRRTYDPQSASTIADRAETTPTTARKHLEQLVESGFVERTSSPDRDATLYRRSSESLVLEQARDILAEMGRDELVARIGELREQIETYRETAGAESPEDAMIDNAALDPSELRDWQTTRRNLRIARAALAIGEAEDAVDTNQVA